MNQEQFKAHVRNRNASMLTLVWPEVKRRLVSGQSPKVIASEMRNEGYWGFTSNCINFADVHHLWQLAVANADIGIEDVPSEPHGENS